jgi:FeS assembly SUF system regulator
MIKLSRMTDYAVSLLTQMVNDGDTVFSASDLAEKTGLSLPTVSKILKHLTKSEIVAASRGAAGGYRLTRPAPAISVASIIEAMDGPIAITDCADNGETDCKIEPLCPMSGNWNKVNQAIRQALENVSLAEMAVPSSPKQHSEEPLLAAGE